MTTKEDKLWGTEPVKQSLGPFEEGFLAVNKLQSRTMEEKDKTLREFNSGGFIKRFQERYGKDAPERFKTMAEDPLVSLSDVGACFGFSRQYAWEIYQKISGRPYSEILPHKKGKKLNPEVRPKGKSHRIRYFLQVRDKLLSLGIECRLAKAPFGFMLVTHRHTLTVKYSKNPVYRGAKLYFYVTNLKGAAVFEYDFLIGVCVNGRETFYYVIPRQGMPTHGAYLQPYSGENDSKYNKFKEAWHLLA